MYEFDRESFRKAFAEYIRHGTPIRLAKKQDQGASHYVWQTEQDEKVRPAHRANDGHLFEWDDPPPTGHPGQDYNCRCRAIPYISGHTEFASFDLVGIETSAPYR